MQGCAARGWFFNWQEGQITPERLFLTGEEIGGLVIALDMVVIQDDIQVTAIFGAGVSNLAGAVFSIAERAAVT